MDTLTLPLSHGDDFAAQLVSVLPPQRQQHPAFQRLARIITGLLEAEDLPDQLDGWHRLSAWLLAGPLWSDVYIGAEDVHGPATQRLAVLIDILQASPPLAAHLRVALRALLEQTDACTLLAELGIPGDRGFVSEFADRLARRLLPQPRDDHELAHLLGRSFTRDRDLRLVMGLQPATFQRLLELLFPASEPEMGAALRRALVDAFRLLLARVSAQGLSAKLRSRSPAGRVAESPFAMLSARGEDLLQAWMAGAEPGPALAAWAAAVGDCRSHMQQISRRLESEGISVDIVYGLDVLDCCLIRLQALVALMTPGPQAAASRLSLLRQLARAARESLSLRHLVRRNLQRLQRRIVERSGKTGEHYVAETSAEYRHIWLAAAGGGLLTVGTAAMKMAVAGAGFALFIEGLASGLNYALSFLLLQAFGLILATKQPAMTAAALAAIIRDRQGEERLDVMVDYAARICRSQLAAASANVALVAGGAYLFDALWRLATGHSYLDRAEAAYVFHALSPVDSGTVFYAALTGVILFLAALVGGWVDNWSVYHRLPQAIAEHRLGARVGQLRMIRLAGVVSRNMSGWATNISLGLMLGMTPVLGKFFGLPLDVRHVTLNSGILTLATASLELPWVGSGLFSLAVLGVATMFVLNLGVSFSLSLWTAVRAYALPAEDLARLRRRLLDRLRQRPQDFLWPPRRS
ncbi:MAG: hypothetical protein ACRCTU_11690 [Zoogloea sp.]|uniref:hypothetical protein n=1 Tax=Zoogloea sp. TaxID=49181 RepID=UPI003F3558B5